MCGKSKFFLFLVLTFLCIGLTGCEQLGKLIEYFKPAQKKPAVVTEKTTTTAREETSAKTTVDVGNVSEDVLAQVGQWSITKSDFQERLQALKDIIPDNYDINETENKKFILDELIRQELMVQEAQKRGLDKDPDIKMAVDEFQRTLLVRQLADQIVANAPSATEEQARQYYEENQADLTEWRLREIVVASEDAAKAILIEILQGADFAATARTKSTSTTAVKGGDLGYINEFDFPQQQQTVLTMKTGDVSSVISGPNGFYIYKLEDKRIQPFEAVKEEIVAGLTLLNQQQAIVKILEDLEQKTPVYRNEQFFEE